ncbi:MAG: hypothetical protein GY841_09625 [FCB group bacterium]|nr:hypothetical protein [FCB group bacterium]
MYEELFDDFDNLKPVLRKNKGLNMPGLGSRLSGNKEFNISFHQLIEKLGRFFVIDKASLAFYDDNAKRLRVTHMYDNRSLKTGLTLNFPTKGSMLYQVLAQGFPVADNYPDHISAGIIEKKILLNNATRSVLMVPLLLDSTKLGLLSLASSNENVFGLYLEGVGVGMVEQFVGLLGNILKPVPETVK